MSFRLTPRSVTLDDLELHKFEFVVNFAGFRRFRTQQQLNEGSIVSDNVVSTSNRSNFWQANASRGFVSDSWAFLFFFARAFFIIAYDLIVMSLLSSIRSVKYSEYLVVFELS